MRDSFILFTIFSLLLLSSCTPVDTTPEFTDELPERHDDISIDMDDDGTEDFELIYLEALVNGIDTDYAFLGRIKTIGENEILLREEDEPLFLRNLNLVNETVTAPLSWNNLNSGVTIVSIHNNADHQWPTTWLIGSETLEDSYFLGLKWETNNVTSLGWVEIEIDERSGEMKLVDKGIL
jgi:hypothetical protein